MLQEARKPRSEFIYDPDRVTDACAFGETLPHSKGFEGLIVLEPVQCWWLAAIFGFRERDTGRRWTREVAFWVPRKNGKALALDTPIPTPTGWARMGDLSIGDEVIGEDGKPARITMESPVYLNHDCYEVAFSNGENIIADAGHRWLTTARVDNVGAGVGQGVKTAGTLTRVRTTQEIFETQTYGTRGDRNHSIAMPAAMEGEHRALPLDPYVLGAWLGDGRSDFASISVSAEDAPYLADQMMHAGFASSIKQDRTCQTLTIRPAIEQRFAAGCGRRSTITSRFASLGVIDNKHIPPAYLRASYAQRLALLQGLMDTDGTIDKAGRGLSFTTTSPALRDGMSELLATFGIKHSVKEKDAVCNGRRLGTSFWSIQFFTTRDALPAFRLPRKLARMKEEASTVRRRSSTVQIASVTKVPSVPVKCIGVDNASHLFLAGRTMIPTHNTELAKIVVTYCQNFEGEPGAEGVIIAGSERQADIPFKAIRHIVDTVGDLREWLLAKGTDEEIRFRRTNAVLKLLAGRAPNLDGLNPHVVLAEEVHAQNQDVIGVIKTSQGARLQPLWLGISTAGRNATGPAYDGWKSDQQVLEGKLRADRVFIAMYAADAEDEEQRFDPIVVEKLNPLYGVSLNPTSLETEEREARKSEAKLQEYKRTRLNIWSRAAGNLFSTEKWDACADPKLTLDAFKGYPMFVGLDLASHSDLNAACFLVCVEEVLYAVFMYWVPERSARFTDDRYADQFAAWKRDGFLNTTKGSHVHHPTIRNDVLEMVRGHNVAGFAFDQHQADYLMGEVEAEGYTAYIVPKVARHITRATDDLVTRHIEPERFQHDGNPISSWCAGNVVAHRDANDNVLPKKEQRGSKQSIDGMDALITANAARLSAEAGMIETAGLKVQKADVYLTRGLLGFD